MKIIYCISGMYKSGGIERVLAGKANYLVSHGYEVAIVTTDQAGRKDFFPIDEQVKRIDLGLNYDELDSLPTWKRYWWTLQMKKTHRALLTEVLQRERADIVVSVLRQEFSFLPTIKDGSKKIFESHTSYYTKVLMYPKEAKLKRFLGLARIAYDKTIAQEYDQVVILTHEEVAHWQPIPQVSVIPNSLPFHPSEHAPLENKDIIAVGRMEYQKNFPELLSIWASVAPRYPEWRLHIWGEGYLLDSLKAQAEKLGIANQTIFEGVTSDMHKAYADSSIYVMTSHFEGLPMVLLEAQATGLPIVSYACPSGPRDIVTDGKDGYLITPYDQDAFKERLIQLMESASLRQAMGQEAVQSAERFTTEAVMRQWETLFQSLVNGKH